MLWLWSIGHVVAQHSAGTPAVVKWFNPTKGFGFVTPREAGSDALLHASVLAKQGKRWLQEGTVVEVVLEEGPKGLVVSELLTIEESELETEEIDAGDWVDAEVKFFNFAKGYGFAVVGDSDESAQDVFFDSRALAQADLDPPRPGDRFKVQLTERPQGCAAGRIKAI
jgi:CspA family cold shock protein